MSKKLTEKQRAANKAKLLKANEKKAWEKYKTWQKANIDDVREGQKITNFREFKEIYNNVGRRISTIKDEVRYQMDTKTAKALQKSYKESTGRSAGNLKEIRKQSTHDIAEKMLDNINEYQKELEKQGLNKKEQRVEISRYFFGS